MHTLGNILHLLRYTGKTYRDFFSIGNADRLLYNAGQNILYWGDSGYQNCLDYTKMDGELQAHKEEILMEYRELPALIRDCFHQQQFRRFARRRFSLTEFCACCIIFAVFDRK